MKLLIGLGNPDEKYALTRHNVGFQFLDFFLKKFGSGSFKSDKYLQSQLMEIEIRGVKFCLIKPQTYMNQSGVAVKECVARYKPQIADDLYIIHDDLDIRLGDYKIQLGKGPKQHGGLESIEQILRTDNFWRVRIGVDNREDSQRTPGEKYVLDNFTKDEFVVLFEVFESIIKSLSL